VSGQGSHVTLDGGESGQGLPGDLHRVTVNDALGELDGCTELGQVGGGETG
jgi:hypothetical protein